MFRYCPSDCSQAACGALLSSAIANQTAWVRDAQPHAPVITYLWDELLDLFKDGSLVIPNGVEVIFTDAGMGKINGANDFHLASCVYYHTAMLDGGANQITEMIPPALIFEQLAAFLVGAGKKFYFVDNVSDLFPVVLSSAATLKYTYVCMPTNYCPLLRL